jgi:hypothetical protein
VDEQRQLTPTLGSEAEGNLETRKLRQHAAVASEKATPALAPEPKSERIGTLTAQEGNYMIACVTMALASPAAIQPLPIAKVTFVVVKLRFPIAAPMFRSVKLVFLIVNLPFLAFQIATPMLRIVNRTFLIRQPMRLIVKLALPIAMPVFPISTLMWRGRGSRRWRRAPVCQGSRRL